MLKNRHLIWRPRNSAEFDPRLAVFTIDEHGDRGMALIELASGATPEEVAVKTQANYRVALS
jgi:acyl CoA:acetate/3-ketoacid CoA transferase beta subunit